MRVICSASQKLDDISQIAAADLDVVAPRAEIDVNGSPSLAVTRAMSSGVTTIRRQKPVCVRTYSSCDGLVGLACSKRSTRARSVGSQSSYSSGHWVSTSTIRASR